MTCDRMDLYTAVGIAEGFIYCDDEDLELKAWQQLIDTGHVWTLQGWFGRRAAELIEAGVCTPAGGEKCQQ